MNPPAPPELVAVADGVHAYLQPDGSWGWSNAGLVAGDDASTLVDTLFDLRLTRRMLDAMAPLLGPRPIASLVNTHANGDHCYGNQLVAGPGVEIVASAATARDLAHEAPERLARAVAGAGDDEMGRFLRRILGPFDFDGIEIVGPTRTFEGRTTVASGGRDLELIEVGPAHTDGDLIAWLPDAGVVFTGDICFIGGTPIMWAGPIANWIAACDRIEALDARVVVPGHGPITDAAGVHLLGDYLRLVDETVRRHHAAGATADVAARELDAALGGTPFARWTDRERLIVTVHALWRALEPGYRMPPSSDLFTRMASYAAGRGW